MNVASQPSQPAAKRKKERNDFDRLNPVSQSVSHDILLLSSSHLDSTRLYLAGNRCYFSFFFSSFFFPAATQAAAIAAKAAAAGPAASAKSHEKKKKKKGCDPTYNCFSLGLLICNSTGRAAGGPRRPGEGGLGWGEGKGRERSGVGDGGRGTGRCLAWLH